MPPTPEKVKGTLFEGRDYYDPRSEGYHVFSSGCDDRRNFGVEIWISESLGFQYPRAFNVAVQTDCQSHSALVAHPDGLGATFRVRVEREVFPSNVIKTELDSLDPTRSKQNSILSSPPLVPAKTPVRSRKATRGISARPSQPSQTVDCSG